MNKYFPSVLRRLTAAALAAALALPMTAHASAGEQKVQTTYPLVKGLDFVNTVTVQPNGGRVESFALELSKRSDAFPILLQGSGTVYAGASINAAVSQAQEMGYQVLGAVNTDFFSPATGVPLGIVIEDGVYKSSPEGRNAIAIDGSRFELVKEPEITITLENQRNDTEVELTHFNKWRSPSGGLYLLNQDFSSVSTRTSTPGWMVRMERTGSKELTVNGKLTLKVTEVFHTDEAVFIDEGEFILTADDASNLADVFAKFRKGDKITLRTHCDSAALEDARWAGGVGDIMIDDGDLTDSDNWEYSKKGADPRTALGVRKDGSAVLYVVDGRKSRHSVGLSQMDLAEELQDMDCEWAVNLDGGGSSAMSAWIPGQESTAIVNQPSDGRPRSCATYLLLVTEDEGNGRADRLALMEDGLVVLTGSSVELGEVAVLDDGLNVLNRDAIEVEFHSEDGLGEFDGNIYAAGDEAGTDTISITSDHLRVEGTGQLHVVDTLTELSITQSGSEEALTELKMPIGQQAQLEAFGSYWGRVAMRDQSGVTWTVDGGVGSVDKDGLFTASIDGNTVGTLTATAGGLTQSIPVKLLGVHLDVDESHWAYKAVEYCYEQELVGGITLYEFGPSVNMRRGDFVLMLYRAAGSPAVSAPPDFTDIAPTDYYADAIAWAQQNQLISGMEDGSFAPNSVINREQSFVILNRTLPLLGIHCEDVPESVLDEFKDLNKMSFWAAPFAATLVAYGIVGGSDGYINPQGTLSRAEMAALVYKLLHFDASSVTLDIPREEHPADGGEDLPEDIPTELPGRNEESSDAPLPTAVSLSHSELMLQGGEQFQLSAVFSPEDAAGKVLWSGSSSVSGAAAVSANGLVTNLNTGRDIVSFTVTASCGTLFSKCTVLCLPAGLSGAVAEDVSALNVRERADTDSDVLDVIPGGTELVILQTMKNGWLQVRYLSPSGGVGEGYVSPDFVTMN